MEAVQPCEETFVGAGGRPFPFGWLQAGLSVRNRGRDGEADPFVIIDPRAFCGKASPITKLPWRPTVATMEATMVMAMVSFLVTGRTRRGKMAPKETRGTSLAELHEGRRAGEEEQEGD